MIPWTMLFLVVAALAIAAVAVRRGRRLDEPDPLRNGGPH